MLCQQNDLVPDVLIAGRIRLHSQEAGYGRCSTKSLQLLRAFPAKL